MITNLVISRGNNSLPFTSNMRPTSIDVTMTITDFDKILTSPTPASLLDTGSVIYNDDNPLDNYIASLTGRNLYTTKNLWPKAKLRLARYKSSLDTLTSPAYMGMKIGNFIPEYMIGPSIFDSEEEIRASIYGDL